MRIKHYQGYGSVNAKVIRKKTNVSFHKIGYKETMLVINVYGNHECGLDVSNDYYEVNKWLVKKVARVDIDYRKITYVNCMYIDNIDNQEAIQYTIYYYEE